MRDAARHANHLLGAKNVSSNAPVFPGYHPASEPGWWQDFALDPSWGALIGAHEAIPGQSTDAFLVTEAGLVKIEGVVRWIPYAAIQRPCLERLSKVPMSRSLDVVLHGGETTFHFPQGDAFTFARYLWKIVHGVAAESARP